MSSRNSPEMIFDLMGFGRDPAEFNPAQMVESWDLRDTGWHVLLQGDAPLDIDIRFPVSEEEFPLMSPGLTAHRPVNAVSYVVNAAPGIRTTAELPQIIANLST